MNIFVGCSSKNDLEKSYYETTMEISTLLKNDLVILGGTDGLMGIIDQNIDSLHKLRIILKDYIPENYNFNEVRTISCNTSMERLQEVWKNTNVFLFLPGGVGTLSEILGFMEENRIHQEKKIFIFNENGYYDMFQQFLIQANELHFNDELVMKEVYFIQNLDELEERLGEER